MCVSPADVVEQRQRLKAATAKSCPHQKPPRQSQKQKVREVPHDTPVVAIPPWVGGASAFTVAYSQ